MKRKIWISTVAGAILVFGTAANMSNNPSQTTSEDSVVINDWLIVGEPGSTTFTPGDKSLTVGLNSRAIGDNSMAMGSGTNALGRDSTAMGNYTNAMGRNSTVMGYFSYAKGGNSLAVGIGSYSVGSGSIAMGSSITTGFGSVAIGGSLRSHGRNTIVVGEHNETNLADSNDSEWGDNEDGHLFVVGNGTTHNDRSNAMVVYHDGAVDVGKNPTDDTVPLKVASNGTVTVNGAVILSEAQGDISMGAFGN